MGLRILGQHGCVPFWTILSVPVSVSIWMHVRPFRYFETQENTHGCLRAVYRLKKKSKM